MRVLTAAVIVVAALAAWAPATSAEDAGETIGLWRLVQVKHPVTDVVNVMASARSGQDHMRLVCKPSEPKARQLMINHQPFLGRGGGRLTYRIDGQPAVDIDVLLYNQSGFVSGADAQAFFAALPGAKRVRLLVTDRIVGPVLAEYDVTGVDKVLARLAELCDGPAKP
ncbi:hypothetical protein QO010_000382 [Caulobacter ginsengisoli]|uniref:Uncharacterized protein n=1 Tax=Caulobacter ginsengisoli TaxID=400775 RepID=A0ABU0IKZ4_9CAUL|nr:hypothetical protein [Caulobacter ginsengisoli]MDQ0462634.1 hypothetical protein [Caulobacter ginsengisoli]